MLKPDAKAHINPKFPVNYHPVSNGFLSVKYVADYIISFVVGSRRERDIEKTEDIRLLETMKEKPVLVSSNQPPGPHWWWYQEIFYKTSETLTSDDVLTLIQADKTKKDRRLAHAHAVVVASKTCKKEDSIGSVNDRYITPEVKQAVWQRDEGRCVRCGSNENLEFDHIIPVSMGGSNTSRNIQLLCEACNRSKGGNII